MKVHLICPGLFGLPSPDPRVLPQTPSLDRLLARADRQESPARDPLETLAAQFGVRVPPGGDLPSAALCLLAEAPDQARAGCWFHADPVHLRADRDRLLLFGGPSLAVTDAEAAALVSAFNAHFEAEGLVLLAPGPNRWYLRVPTVPRLHTQPMHRVSGRPLDAARLTGPEAGDWHRWQNEAQMLFYQHQVNRAREAAGRPGINGVWTWGGGVLPQVQGGPDLVVADHPLGLGLGLALGARLFGLRELVQPPSTWQAPAPESVLIFWDRLWWPALAADSDAWRAALGELDTLVAGLMADLGTRRVGSLLLDDGEHRRFVLTAWGLRRFWRRGGLRGRLAPPR